MELDPIALGPWSPRLTLFLSWYDGAVRTVVQRVAEASVAVDGETIGRIAHGLLLLIGVERGDTQADVNASVRKIAGMRCFPAAAPQTKPMERSLEEVGGSILAISQFTLAANLVKGRRPSFNPAADPDVARPLYEAFVQGLRQSGLAVETGRFGAHMVVSLANDGPVTFILRVRDGSVLPP